jgi:hypothetical protein
VEFAAAGVRLFLTNAYLLVIAWRQPPIAAKTQKVAALIFSKPPEMSMIKDCYTTAFFFCRRAAVFQIILLLYPKLE